MSLATLALSLWLAQADGRELFFIGADQQLIAVPSRQKVAFRRAR